MGVCFSLQCECDPDPLTLPDGLAPVFARTVAVTPNPARARRVCSLWRGRASQSVRSDCAIRRWASVQCAGVATAVVRLPCGRPRCRAFP